MAYEKQTWTTGDVITAQKLNHMEDGIANGSESSGVFNVNSSFDEQLGEVVLDKTWQEIYDASKNGALVVVLNEAEETGCMFSGKEIVCAISYEAKAVPEYRVYTLRVSGDNRTTIMYTCDSSTDFLHEFHND